MDALGNINKNMSYTSICDQQSIHLTVAYNNEPDFEIDLESQTMVKFRPNIVKGLLSNIPYDWEILDIFFKQSKITPTWINCNYTWGTYLKDTGMWNGAVGQVFSKEFIMLR